MTASALATLDEISGGRMDLGIGRGDASVRSLGKPPATMKTLEQAATATRDLLGGCSTGYEGVSLELPWTGRGFATADQVAAPPSTTRTWGGSGRTTG